MVCLVTFCCYGPHLPGDPRGSFDHVRRGEHRFFPPKPGLEDYSRRIMKQPVFLLASQESREIVRDAIRSVCQFRSWILYALHVRTNHVHGVLQTDASAGRVLNDWKAYATRSLRSAGVVSEDRWIWVRGGNVAALKSPEAVFSAIRYVLEKQGEPMAVHCAKEKG